MAIPSQVLLAFFEICGIFLGSSIYISTLVYIKQPDPYMDEIFHVKQAQAYCDGNFSQWDPKITTLPGLYLTSVGVLKPISDYLHFDGQQLCGAFWLRLSNVAFAVGNFYLIFELVKKIHHKEQDTDEWKTLLTALNLSIFPVLYFFTFLYYTDPGSTFIVLLTYLLHLHGNTSLAALTGAISILFRQTNIIWVIFVAGLNAAKVLRSHIQKKGDKNKPIMKDEDDSISQFYEAFSKLSMKIARQPKCVLDIVSDVICNAWQYMAVGACFVAFIILNGGIVVGDRSAHQACLHFPQLFYFSSVSFGLGFPCFLSLNNVFRFLRHVTQRPLLYAALVVIALCLVWQFTYAHPYLLADNRHYVFYVWSKIYRKHELVKFGLVPIYIFMMYCLSSKLENKDIWWRLVYLICVVMATVPQKLMEFRYFILPYLILRMNISLVSYPRLIIEFAVYALVNAVTIYLFLNRPFEWENAPGVAQRFLW